jgi:hypothetical protein
MTPVIDDFDSPALPPPAVDSAAFQNCDTQARMDIGDSRDTSLAVLLLLAGDDNADVRFALAENHNINKSVLRRLLEDSNPFVACRAQKTLARLKCNTAIFVPLSSEAGTVEGCTLPNPRGKQARQH